MEKQALQDIIKRVELLEREVFGSRRIQNRDRKATSEPVSLSSHLLQLRDEGFFKEPRTAQETHEKLAPIYPCVRKRVNVELGRIARRKQLRKAAKPVEGKALIAYVW